jgi:iron complex transport system ATP-binding protein
VRQGLPALAVLHDLNLAAVTCDRLLLLVDGSVVAAGPPRDVLTTPLLERAFGARILVGHHAVAGVPTVMPLP